MSVVAILHWLVTTSMSALLCVRVNILLICVFMQLKRLPLQYVKGLQHLQKQLKVLIVQRCLNDMEVRMYIYVHQIAAKLSTVLG